MPLQIANPGVVAKVEREAKRTGLSKTAVVERAMDQLAAEPAPQRAAPAEQQASRLVALLAQIDRIPDRGDKVHPLQWDRQGLPR